MAPPLLLLVCLTLVAPGRVDDDERPDDRPEIATLLEDLAARVRKSAREDPRDLEAVEVIQSLGTQWERSGDHDRAAIVRGLDRVFLAKRPVDKDGSRASQLFTAAAKSLAKTEDGGAKKLLRWIGHAKFKRDLALQRELVLALGQTRADRGIDTIRDLLREDVPELLSAAAIALGNFDGKDQKVRKSLFESLLKTMESAKESARGGGSTASGLWNALRGPGTTTLGQLSGANENHPEEWRRWWNKNKRKDWDDPGW